MEKAALNRYLSQVTHPEGLEAWRRKGQIDDSEQYLQHRLRGAMQYRDLREAP